MSEAKHTPGPWMWHWATDFNGNADGRVHTDPRKNVQFGTAQCVAVSPRYQTREQWEADASLIAAAPDMLEALRRVRADSAFHPMSAQVREMVKAAIFKAESHSPSRERAEGGA